MKVDDTMYGRFLGLKEGGMTISDIAAHCKVARRTVVYNLAHGPPSRRTRAKNSEPSPQVKKRRNLVKKLISKRVVMTEKLVPKNTLEGRPRRNAKVPRVQHRHPHGSLRKCRRELATKHGINVSKTTIQRDRVASGLVCKRRGRGPERRLGDDKKRLAWAKKYLPFAKRHKSDVLFIDEKIFDSLDSDVFAYVLPGETPPPREAERFPPRVHCVGMIGKGVKILHVFRTPHRVGTQEYREEFLVPHLRKLSGKYILHDGCGAHKGANAWLLSKQAQVKFRGLIQDFPARSPDANLIERMWAIVQPKVGESGPLTEEEMPVYVQRAWDAIPQAVVDALVMSWDRQLGAIIAAKGASTSKPLPL